LGGRKAQRCDGVVWAGPFEAVGLGGDTSMLAQAGLRSEHRVGRYGVDLGGFERIVHIELWKPADEVDLFVIDEEHY
jgi:nucleoside-triphosphatase THEP1